MKMIWNLNRESGFSTKQTTRCGDVLTSLVLRRRWFSVHLQGPESLKHAAWIALSSAGLTVLGFTPAGITTQTLDVADQDSTAPNNIAFEPPLRAAPGELGHGDTTLGSASR